MKKIVHLHIHRLSFSSFVVFVRSFVTLVANIINKATMTSPPSTDTKKRNVQDNEVVSTTKKKGLLL